MSGPVIRPTVQAARGRVAIQMGEAVVIALEPAVARRVAGELLHEATRLEVAAARHQVGGSVDCGECPRTQGCESGRCMKARAAA